MYPEYLQLSLEKVAEHREANTALQPARMTAEEKDVLLKGFHPDYRKDQYTELRAGANKGDKVNTELAETLMGKSRIHVRYCRSDYLTASFFKSSDLFDCRLNI